MQQSTAIIQGSLGAIAKRDNKSLAESFVSCDVIVICDVSGSMSAKDARGNRKRYDVACEELSNLQTSMPGKIGVVAFSSFPQFCPNGIPIFSGGGTDMKEALKFCKVADIKGMRFFLISDGQPNEPDETLVMAKTYKNRIDTIFVGPEQDQSSRDFLSRLAKLSGGQAVTCAKADMLSAGISKLLSSGQ